MANAALPMAGQTKLVCFLVDGTVVVVVLVGTVVVVVLVGTVVVVELVGVEDVVVVVSALAPFVYARGESDRPPTTSARVTIGSLHVILEGCINSMYWCLGAHWFDTRPAGHGETSHEVIDAARHRKLKE